MGTTHDSNLPAGYQAAGDGPTAVSYEGALEFVADLLEDAGPLPASEVKAAAADVGIPGGLLRRVAVDLCVRYTSADRSPFVVLWSLPEDPVHRPAA